MWVESTSDHLSAIPACGVSSEAGPWGVRTRALTLQVLAAAREPGASVEVNRTGRCWVVRSHKSSRTGEGGRPEAVWCVWQVSTEVCSRPRVPDTLGRREPG